MLVGMSVVRGVGEVCDMCVFGSWREVFGVTGLDLGFTHSGGTWEMCLCSGGVRGEWVAGLG